MRLKVLFLLVLSGVCVQACGKDEEPAPPGRSVGDGTDGGDDGGGINPPFIPGGDGDGDGDEDGGDAMDSGQLTDAGAAGPTRCLDFEAVPPLSDPLPDMSFNIVTLPQDLAVTRASATWDLDCAQPTLVVQLSNGNCPDGDGHEITFFIEAKGAEDSTLVLGQNVVREDPAGRIHVRYRRPGRNAPSGEWGTCEGVTGTLDLLYELAFIKGRRLQGEFLIDLTRCDDGEPSVQTIEGELNVEIPESLNVVCPPAP